MNRQAKSSIINYLVEQLKNHNSFYVIDATHLSVSAIEQFRRSCQSEQAVYKVVKNTLVLKALAELSSMDNVYESLKNDVLKKVTGIVFIKDNAQKPAKIILNFRKLAETDKPILKGAYVDGELFIGNDKLEILAKLKSKQELLGELIAMLQSPIQHVLSSLRGGQHQLMGMLQTLGDRKES